MRILHSFQIATHNEEFTKLGINIFECFIKKMGVGDDNILWLDSYTDENEEFDHILPLASLQKEYAWDMIIR